MIIRTDDVVVNFINVDALKIVRESSQFAIVSIMSDSKQITLRKYRKKSRAAKILQEIVNLYMAKKEMNEKVYIMPTE